MEGPSPGDGIGAGTELESSAFGVPTIQLLRGRKFAIWFYFLVWSSGAVAIHVLTGGSLKLIHDVGFFIDLFAWWFLFYLGVRCYHDLEELLSNLAETRLVEPDRIAWYRDLMYGRGHTAAPSNWRKLGWLRRNAHGKHWWCRGPARFFEWLLTRAPAFCVPAAFGVAAWAALLLHLAATVHSYPLTEPAYTGGFVIATHYGSVAYILFSATVTIPVVILFLIGVFRLILSTIIVRDLGSEWTLKLERQSSLEGREVHAYLRPLDRRFTRQLRALSTFMVSSMVSLAVPLGFYLPVALSETSSFGAWLAPAYFGFFAAYCLLGIVLPIGLSATGIDELLDSIRKTDLDRLDSEIRPIEARIDAGERISEIEHMRYDRLIEMESKLDDLSAWFLNRSNLQSLVGLIVVVALSGFVTYILSFIVK